MKKIERIRAFLRKTIAAFTPSQSAWHGATVGVYVLVTALVLAFFIIYFVQCSDAFSLTVNWPSG